MEVNVRLNADIEKDFAFQVDHEDTIKTKIARIFRKDGTGMGHLMVLRPTVFHKEEPTGFYKSMHPGYMTEGGCLIFDYDADEREYLQLLEEDRPILEQVWPGQLVLPRWEISKSNIYRYVAIMLAWLYTDLPDCISPTPGICMTNNMSRLIIPLLQHFELFDFADRMRQEITPGYSSLFAQWAFFSLHIGKILLITLFFGVGLCNPISFNPYKVIKVTQLDLAQPKIKNLVKSLGWVGIRRGTFDEYQSHFYQYITKKYGGPVGASKAGKLRMACNPGFPLGDGEGFQTPLSQRFELHTFEEIEKKGLFYISEDYFVELENNLKQNIEKCNGDIGLMNTEVKRFRRFGLFEPDAKIEHMVELRKKTYEKMHEEEESKIEKDRLEKVAKRRQEERRIQEKLANESKKLK